MPTHTTTRVPSRRTAAPWTLAASCIACAGLLALGAGCGGSSSGGGRSSPSSANGTVSNLTITDQGSYRFLVEFTLTSTVSQELGIDVEFSEDLGESFDAASVEDQSAPAGAEAAPSRSYIGSPVGASYQVVWTADADLATLAQHDLVLRVTPYHLSTSTRGTGATSSVFGIGANSAPAVSALSSPVGTVGGWVTLDYTVSDAESDRVSVEMEYSLDGGATYAAATIGQGDGVISVVTSPAGEARTIAWSSQADAPERTASAVRLRLRCADTEASDWVETGTFAIRTYAPAIDLLTVNRIPASMNGSTSYLDTGGTTRSFSLLVPEFGFVIWMGLSIHVNGAAIDPTSIELTSAAPLGGGSAAGGYDAGSDFGALLSWDAGTSTASLEVSPSIEFEHGSHTISAVVRDVLGNTSSEVGYSFETTVATPVMRPFENTDVWFLDFTRDNFTITSTTSGSGTVSVSTSFQSNGVADFVEDLRLLGLNSASPPQSAVDAGLNDVVRELVEQSIVGHLNIYFGHEFDGSATSDSVAIEFTRTPAGSTSQIAVGGDDPIPGFTIGRAEFDYRNASGNDDTDVDLGVFSTNLIEFYINSSFTFKSRFDPFISGRGTPLGFHSVDVTVLADTFDRFAAGNSRVENDRYDDLMAGIDAMARVIATILAHEIGHSIGLVANNAPSAGLFGGQFNASFAGPYTTTFHLDTAGNNIMAAAISFSGSIQTGSAAPFFNELNIAYLQERVLLD